MKRNVKYFLFGLAMRDIPSADPQYEECAKLTYQMMHHPACADIDLTDGKQRQLVQILKALDARPKPDRDEAILVALERLKHEKEFDPFLFPFAKTLKHDNATYLHLRDAFGVIAIAWQLHVYGGNRLVLSVDSYNRNVAPRSVPPS